MKNNIKRLAFSLIELMISLITISLITAAMAPVVTKKLNSSAVVISQGNAAPDEAVSDITNNCVDNSNFGSSCSLCTPKYCIICGLENCPDGQYLDSKKCECQNCSDRFGSMCKTCNANACTKCESSSYYISNGSCLDCPSGSFCDGEKLYATCPNMEGYFCDATGIHKCKDIFGPTCYSCTQSACTECEVEHFLQNGRCVPCNLTGCYSCTSTTNCTECYEDWVLSGGKCTTKCANAISNCLYCNGSSTNCTTCQGGYFLNSSKKCARCSVSNCLKCVDNTARATCETCKAGYYLSNGACATCKSKFGSNCVACSSSQCLSCAQNYHIKDSTLNPACVAADSKFNCSDSNFMKIGDLCVTRKNMGDALSLSIPSSVIVAKAGSGEICYTNIQKCCWQGTTANGYDSENGGYSGQNRTLCNWEAAKEICDKFNFANKTWRLPTIDELATFANGYSIALGSSGLMLCDGSAGFSSAQCADGLGGLCKVPYGGGYCHPDYVWSGTLFDTLYVSGYHLYSGVWYREIYSPEHAFSVRCVAKD